MPFYILEEIQKQELEEFKNVFLNSFEMNPGV